MTSFKITDIFKLRVILHVGYQNTVSSLEVVGGGVLPKLMYIEQMMFNFFSNFSLNSAGITRRELSVRHTFPAKSSLSVYLTCVVAGRPTKSSL